MNRAFSYYFPEGAYSPLGLNSQRPEQEQAWVARERRFPRQHIITQFSLNVLTNNNSLQLSNSGENIYTCINVPASNVVTITSRTQETPVKLMGPTRVVFCDPCVMTKNAMVTLSKMDIKAELEPLDKLLVKLQKNLCIRMFREVDLQDDASDIGVGYTVNLQRLLRYKSMLIPYGLEVVGLGLTGDRITIKGPLIINNIHMDSVYYGPPIQSHKTMQSFVRDYSPTQIDANEHARDQRPYLGVAGFVGIQGITVRLSESMYKELRPLIGYYLLARCLGRSGTQYLESSLPYMLDDDDMVPRLVFHWLMKFNGDYSIIVPFLEHPRYGQQARKALSKYTQTVTKAPSQPVWQEFN